MYSRVISTKQPTFAVLLTTGAVLFLVALSLLPNCSTAHALVATSSMEHQWSAIEHNEHNHQEHHCHIEDFARDVLAQSKNTKTEWQPDFFLIQELNSPGLPTPRPANTQFLSFHHSPTAPVFLLTQRLRI